MNCSNGWYVASVQAPTPYVFSDKSVSRYLGWTPCIEWCNEQFGNNVIDGWRFQGEGVFEFCEERDYAWFLLRWS